jgi:hypothetical protein
MVKFEFKSHLNSNRIEQFEKEKEREKGEVSPAAHLQPPFFSFSHGPPSLRGPARTRGPASSTPARTPALSLSDSQGLPVGAPFFPLSFFLLAPDFLYSFSAATPSALGPSPPHRARPKSARQPHPHLGPSRSEPALGLGRAAMNPREVQGLLRGRPARRSCPAPPLIRSRRLGLP